MCLPFSPALLASVTCPRTSRDNRAIPFSVLNKHPSSLSCLDFSRGAHPSPYLKLHNTTFVTLCQDPNAYEPTEDDGLRSGLANSNWAYRPTKAPHARLTLALLVSSGILTYTRAVAQYQHRINLKGQPYRMLIELDTDLPSHHQKPGNKVYF
jgi:hypothetical protein